MTKHEFYSTVSAIAKRSSALLYEGIHSSDGDRVSDDAVIRFWREMRAELEHIEQILTKGS